jgi:hypothetical protein
MHCKVKACPFPAITGYELCRGHLEDQIADCSLMPSTLVLLERSPNGVTAGSWDEYQRYARE